MERHQAQKIKESIENQATFCQGCPNQIQVNRWGRTEKICHPGVTSDQCPGVQAYLEQLNTEPDKQFCGSCGKAHYGQPGHCRTCQQTIDYEQRGYGYVHF